MKSQELKELSFCIVFRKNNWQKFQKKCQVPYFWTLFAQILAKMNFPKKLAFVTF